MQKKGGMVDSNGDWTENCSDLERLGWGRGGVEICYMRHDVVGGWYFAPCSVTKWELGGTLLLDTKVANFTN